MSVFIAIKRREPRGKVGPDLWNIVVHGPREIFPGKLGKFLVLQGLEDISDDPDRAVWATRPAPVPPPWYLAGLLASKYGVKIAKDTAEKALAPVREVLPEDGLERFIGRSRERSAGAAPLRVEAGRRTFIANCDEDNASRRAYLEGAGWLPLEKIGESVRQRFGTAPYVTGDPFIAGNLEHLMVPAARAVMGRRLAEASAAIRLSRSHEPPENFDTPAPEDVAYLPFQMAGIRNFSGNARSGILADDMGLGKTIQGIGVLNARPDAKNVLVVCQANMRLKWVREILKWKVNGELSVAHAEGNDFPDTDIVVINYDILDRHRANIQSRRWDLVLGDEAHNMKNPEAKRTQALLGDVVSADPGVPAVPLAEGGQLIHMSGTPKPNRISDLWPLLTSTRPDIWGRGPAAYRAFLNRYQPPRHMKKKMSRAGREFTVDIELPGDPIREMELQMRMRGSGSFVRRLKRDTDLPPKFRTPIELPFRLSAEDRKALAEVDADIEALAQKVAAGSGAARVGRSMPAREVIDTICGIAPGSPHFTEGARVRANLGRLKAPYMARFIAEELQEDDEFAPEERRKTVVFAHHKDVISRMAGEIRKTFPNGVLVYDGSISSARKRQEIVDRFESDPEARVFLMSLSGASGITLTASHRMRIAEPDWTPANMSQIEDRIWRIGQEKPCDIGYLFVPESHDLNVGLGLIRKMETDEKALNTFRFGRRAGTPPPRKASGDGIEEDSASEMAVAIRAPADTEVQMSLPLQAPGS